MKNGLGLLLVLWFFVWGLQGCTSVQVEPKPIQTTQEMQQAWQKRQQLLTNNQRWLLNGRASVTYRDENWPFSLQWKQSGAQNYAVKIYHPLTRNRLGKLTKQANSVSFTNSKGRVYRNASAERLLQQHLTIKIPIEGMQYWVRGVAAPQYSLTSYQLDRNGRPSSIQQAGWTVSYADYENKSYDARPQRVEIFRSKPELIRVKMRIKQWGE